MKIEDIKRISEETNKRYSDRLQLFGGDVKTLGWDTKENQYKRFDVVYNNINLFYKKILEIGCGFADFLEYLLMKGPVYSYRGIDINSDLIEVARKKHEGFNLEVRNILTETINFPEADVVILLGLLNFKIENNLEYTRAFIEQAFKLTDDYLVVDFLSSYRDSSYPAEDAVYYHNPKDVLDICFELTDNVRLIHDYPSIPQREGMVILRKKYDNYRLSRSCEY